MSASDRFKRKEWQFLIRAEMKRVDRELKRLETEKAQAWKQIAARARKGCTETTQALARSVVQAQAAATRLHKARASLHSIDLQLTLANTAGSGDLGGIAAEVLRELSKLAGIAEVAPRLEELHREVAVCLGVDVDLERAKQGDGAAGEEEVEAAAQVQQQLEELSLDQLGPLTGPGAAPALLTRHLSVEHAFPEKPRSPMASPAPPEKLPMPAVQGPGRPQDALAPRQRKAVLALCVCLAVLSSVPGVLYCMPSSASRTVMGILGIQHTPAVPLPEKALRAGGPPASGAGGPVLQQERLTRPGSYDLRVERGGRLLGCASPASRFPDAQKYGCSGNFSTPESCDAARHPVKDTAYVAAVHAGCETGQGRGTYGYAYDDSMGLRQCAPVTRYEWVLCPDGSEGPIGWKAERGPGNSTRRFRVSNRCGEPVWVLQVGARVPHERAVQRIEANASYTYAIPDRGLPSATFLPKTGCDSSGGSCDVQSAPPCPRHGCAPGIDTRFGASWGCVHALESAEAAARCALTGQGKPSTFLDWWDGSAVNGWTLPFSILVDADSSTLNPSTCGSVVCAKLDASKLCPREEFLTPEW